MLITAGFMLDTCAINRIHEGCVDAGAWTLRGPIYITDIQIQEILQTTDADLRSALFSTLLRLRSNIVRPSQSIYDACGLPGDYGCDFGLARDSELGRRSDELSFGRRVPYMMKSLPGSPKRVENRLRDAFIAQTAHINNLTLVTADRKLADAATTFGVVVEFIRAD